MGKRNVETGRCARKTKVEKASATIFGAFPLPREWRWGEWGLRKRVSRERDSLAVITAPFTLALLFTLWGSRPRKTFECFLSGAYIYFPIHIWWRKSSLRREYTCNLFLIPCLSGLLPAHMSCWHPFRWSCLISYFPIRLAIPRGRRLNCCEKRFRFEILEQGHIAKKKKWADLAFTPFARGLQIPFLLPSLSFVFDRGWIAFFPGHLVGTWNTKALFIPLSRSFLPSFFSLFLGRGTRDDPNICSIRSRIRRKSRSFVPSPTFYRVGNEREIVVWWIEKNWDEPCNS